MKKTIYMMVSVTALMLCLASCSDDDTVQTEVLPASTGTFIDVDGREYNTVTYGSLEWLAENYKGGEPWVEQSYFTDNGIEAWFEYDFDVDEEEELMEQNGNYMNYQQAVDNCPEGWRLPTDEDWKQLEGIVGVKAVDALGWRDGGGFALMSAGGLHLTLFGVLRSESSAYYVKCELGDYGTYWTSTIDTAMSFECAFIRKVIGSRDIVMRNSMPTGRYAMVRYVRDVK